MSGSKIGIMNYSYYDNNVVYATITSVDTTNKKLHLTKIFLLQTLHHILHLLYLR